ncbi:erythromycin esterase family protein [Bacillus suaedae]|uniref:Erythromycin esterase family protein n=1 Tax=Halalkalibacter suaedae TaxID=2822140 RepID=A0A941AMP4_9BACI|nr:erythromycin esterase family protein [Bacillus suaedae]MBP3950755.1 erythromycin esterase family protein [Bacillus suaedae]
MVKTLDLTSHIKEHSIRFDSIKEMEPLLQAAADAQFVLLGEASHGTSEFYTWRTEISKWLIEEKGFHFIAVEGDWPSCYEVNRFIKGYNDTPDAKTSLKAFNRWPTWMWANEEVVNLVEWLKIYNEQQSSKEKVGFYGIDVYSLWESMEAVVDHLEKIKSPVAEYARKAFQCFEPFNREPQMYGVSAALYGEDCFDELMELLNKLHQARHQFPAEDESSLNLHVNALVTNNAEDYYRAMMTNDNQSWNIRDQHMVSAIDMVANYYGKDAKGIIWEHNTHIGDARATDMAKDELVNVGQLTREKYGEEKVYAIGFGTYEGTVMAATKWGEKQQIMSVPKATLGSWEDFLHRAGAFNKFIMFNKQNHHLFSETIGHRAIGVSYNPKYEHLGNYVPSQISERYNAFIHIEQSEALHPL